MPKINNPLAQYSLRFSGLEIAHTSISGIGSSPIVESRKCSATSFSDICGYTEIESISAAIADN